MMRRASHQIAAVAVLVCLANFAAAEDLASLSDVQLADASQAIIIGFRVQQLQTELMSLMSELQKQSGGQEYKGGTEAAGFVKGLVEKMAAERGA